jgi:hypothetical protein
MRYGSLYTEEHLLYESYTRRTGKVERKATNFIYDSSEDMKLTAPNFTEVITAQPNFVAY